MLRGHEIHSRYTIFKISAYINHVRVAKGRQQLKKLEKNEFLVLSGLVVHFAGSDLRPVVQLLSI